jgi:SAM-dependent methyltransferase
MVSALSAQPRSSAPPTDTRFVVHRRSVLLLPVAALVTGLVSARDDAPQAPASLDVPFVPTPNDVVSSMLRLANVRSGDIVYDLGCGDGRIVVAAARRGKGVRAVGVDIDPRRIADAEENARKAGVSDRTRFIRQDLFEADLREATVVTLYLLPSLNVRLRPKLLAELSPGTRIVSHGFDMGDWQPAATRKVGTSTVYYWIVPERK